MSRDAITTGFPNQNYVVETRNGLAGILPGVYIVETFRVDATASGATLTATATLIAGSATGQANAAGALLTASSSLVSGDVGADASASGAVSTADATLLAGAASAESAFDVSPIVGGGPFRPIYSPRHVFPQNASIEGVIIATTARLSIGLAFGTISISATTPQSVNGINYSILPGLASGERNWSDDELFMLLEVI